MAHCLGPQPGPLLSPRIGRPSTLSVRRGSSGTRAGGRRSGSPADAGRQSDPQLSRGCPTCPFDDPGPDSEPWLLTVDSWWDGTLRWGGSSGWPGWRDTVWPPATRWGFWPPAWSCKSLPARPQPRSLRVGLSERQRGCAHSSWSYLKSRLTFTTSERSVTVNLARSHFGGPNLMGGLLDIPHGSFGRPSQL